MNWWIWGLILGLGIYCHEAKDLTWLVAFSAWLIFDIACKLDEIVKRLHFVEVLAKDECWRRERGK